MDHSWGYGTEQRLREENQDCHGVFEFPDYTLAIVCDGMGGHVGGAQAATLAVRTLHDALEELQGRPVQQALEEAIQRTNLVIYEAARKNHRLMGMGTTVVAAVITPDTCYLAHVGDSRAYLVRKGVVTQLTRDHTMVNLFVDAELLSPEDAATHPEAHVLSRSLGVERQVDVELSDPIALDPGDVVFLCSDGVHGVVTDWELANVDWRAPHEAIGQVLGIVGTREGDDNASAVAVMMGTSFEDVPPTPVPEPKRFDEAAMLAGGLTAVPLDEELSDSIPSPGHDSGDTSPSGGGAGSGYVVYEDNPIIEPASDPGHDRALVPAPIEIGASNAHAPDPTAAVQPPPQPSSKPKLSAQRRRTPVLPVVVAGAALVAAFGVVVLLLLPNDGGSLTDEEPTDNVVVVTPGHETPSPNREPRPEPRTDAEGAPEPAAAAAVQAILDPELPQPPRRLPHRPQRCTQPPPGGPEQFRAVEAARRRECALSLEAVQAGMKKSIDHCRLYQQSWLCFNEAHERPLEQAEAITFADLQFELFHLEGTRDKGALPKELEAIPAWYRPANDGLEYRLEAWSSDDEMAEYVGDLFGVPKVADDIARDVHIEALVAAGLARVAPEERTPVMIDAWARRVYVVASSLNGRAGRVLNQHREGLVPVLRELLEQSIADREGPDGKPVKVPDAVREAYDVGMGNKPPPTAKPVVKRDRNAFVEPPIPEDEGDIQVNRASD